MKVTVLLPGCSLASTNWRALGGWSGLWHSGRMLLGKGQTDVQEEEGRTGGRQEEKHGEEGSFCHLPITCPLAVSWPPSPAFPLWPNGPPNPSPYLLLHASYCWALLLRLSVLLLAEAHTQPLWMAFQGHHFFISVD